MKDFRSQLRPPAPPTHQTAADVARLLDAGQLSKALRMARRLGVAEAELRPLILAAAQSMYHHRRAAELLSVIGVFPVDLGYSVDDLLRRVYETRDYHGFLKQTHRLGAGAAFGAEIETAMQDLARRGRAEEAEAWRRKFAEGDAASTAERANSGPARGARHGRLS